MYSMTAYQYAKNKNLRNAIRKFAGLYPEAYNWSSLGIQPLTEEMTAEQKKKQAQKRKKKNEKKKEKKILANQNTDQNNTTEQNDNIQINNNEQNNTQTNNNINIQANNNGRLSRDEIDSIVHDITKARNVKSRTMNDREKRAIAAENRQLKQQGTPVLCHVCKQDLLIIPPWEYDNKQFCKDICVKEYLLLGDDI